MDRDAVHRWQTAYDAAGIRTGAAPPVSLLELVAEADHIVTSAMRRAVASAERLAPTRPIRQSDLLRETPLPIPEWPTRLPFSGWSLARHSTWMYQILRGVDASERERARASEAATMLTGIAADGSTVLVVTHGVFRRLVGRELIDRGWKSLGRRGGYQHWSAWSFAGPDKL